MANVEASSLVRKSYKVVMVHMYNPYLGDEALEGFLARYGRVLTGVRYLRDEFGIWTGKRQFRVDLREDPKGYDGLCHPPAFFFFGRRQGFFVLLRAANVLPPVPSFWAYGGKLWECAVQEL